MLDNIYFLPLYWKQILLSRQVKKTIINILVVLCRFWVISSDKGKTGKFSRKQTFSGTAKFLWAKVELAQNCSISKLAENNTRDLLGDYLFPHFLNGFQEI